MRVLIWTEFFWPSLSGGELFTLNLMRGLHGRGIEFAAVTGTITHADPIRERVDDFAVHRFPFRRALGQRDPHELARIRAALLEVLREFAPDVLHMTWMGPCG